MQLDRLEEAKVYLVDQEVPMEMGVSTQDPKGQMQLDLLEEAKLQSSTPHRQMDLPEVMKVQPLELLNLKRALLEKIKLQTLALENLMDLKVLPQVQGRVLT